MADNLNLAVVNQPADVIVTAPDVQGLVADYSTQILPFSTFRIVDAASYVQAKRNWSTAKTFSDRVEAMFADSKKKAYAAHKAITGLESQLLAPVKAVMKVANDEILRFEAEEKAARIKAEQEEFRRRQAAAEAERQQQIAAMEEQRRLAAAQAEEDAEELPPWMTASAAAQPAHIELAIPLPPPVEVEPVRFLSTLPEVFGGPVSKNKPWQAQVFDLDAFWEAAYKDKTLRVFFEVDQPALNKKAREHGADLEKVIPGVRGVQEQTLTK
tara:strand:+ start:5023 stop:5832 length:810 start_codon:yes stop_codon:yes gene_type:complete